MLKNEAWVRLVSLRTSQWIASTWMKKKSTFVGLNILTKDHPKYLRMPFFKLHDFFDIWELNIRLKPTGINCVSWHCRLVEKFSEIHKTLKSHYNWIKFTLTWRRHPAWRRHGYHFYIFGDTWNIEVVIVGRCNLFSLKKFSNWYTNCGTTGHNIYSMFCSCR